MLGAEAVGECLALGGMEAVMPDRDVVGEHW